MKPVDITFSGTKAEAYARLDQLRQEVQAGFHRDDEATLFGEFAKQWHEARENSGTLSKTTIAREKGIVRRLRRYLGNVRLVDITPQVVESTLLQIRRDGIARRGCHSNTTLNKEFKTLRQILDKAESYSLILNNPADKVDVPKPEECERRSLSVAEVQRLLHAIDAAETNAYAQRDSVEVRRSERGDTSRPSSLRGMCHISYVIAARLGLATGMRRGEVMGLTWDCVDIERGCLRVAHSANVYGEVKEPKTKSSNRVIAIDETTIQHLRLWLSRQREELALLGLQQHPSTPVCCSDRGVFINPTHFSRWWRSFADSNGFVGLGFHELRHTQATQLIAHGTDMKEVQHRLGHASFSLTMNLYAHALPESDREAARVIGGMFSESSGDKASGQVLRLVG